MSGQGAAGKEFPSLSPSRREGGRDENWERGAALSDLASDSHPVYIPL